MSHTAQFLYTLPTRRLLKFWYCCYTSARIVTVDSLACEQYHCHVQWFAIRPIRGSSHIVYIYIFTHSPAQWRIAAATASGRQSVSQSTSSCSVARLAAGRSCRRFYHL